MTAAATRKRSMPARPSKAPDSRPFVQKLFSAEYGLTTFCVALGLVYGAVPWAIYEFFIPEDSFVLLSQLTGLTIVGLLVGSKLSIFDARFQAGGVRVRIGPRIFHGTTWAIFIAFVVITFATAPSIPLISAFKGASSSDLAMERGDFLKTRQGAEIALLYISTFLINTIIPYSVVLLYATKSTFRHLCAALFFLFCISFLQKTLFLNLVLPLLAYFAMSQHLRRKVALLWISASVGILIAATYLSLGDISKDGDGRLDDPSTYLSAAYGASTPLDYLLWRAVAVPVFTASDTLIVHAQQFGSRPLMGATSSFLAALTGQERVNIERIVFEHQFGGWSDIGNANAVFITDAFVNFGSTGTFIIALMIGQIFRWFRISKDIGFTALWPLFAFVLFSAPFIGMLFSNGFAYMLLHAAFIRVQSQARK